MGIAEETNMGTCNAVGCGKPTGRYGPYCGKHAARRRSQGHVDQSPVSRRELVPYLAIVRPIIARNRHTEAMRITKARWERHLEDCRAVMERATVHWPTWHAARAILSVAQEVGFEAVLETVCAAFLFVRRDQHRFRSDEAFAVQHARLVRRLGTTAVGTKADPRTGKAEGVYRAFPLNASITLHDTIVQVIGPLVARIIRAAEAEKQEAESYRETLKEIA